MERTDTDMMDHGPSITSSASTQTDDIRRMLALARQLIHQGKPSQALQAVVTVMRANGGESAAFHTLNRAKELYRSKLNENNAADELATLFAECAIAEAFPSIAEPSPSNNMGSHQSLKPDACGTSILTETGRNQVMMDAFSDGSSFVCLHCGGLVGSNRKEEHYAFWCGQRQYRKLDSKEEENDIYKITKARERRRRDLENVRYIKDEGGRTIVREEDIRKRWGEYFSSLFNESPSNESRPEGSGEVVSSSPHMHCDCYYSRINQEEVRDALQKMGRNKAVGSYQIPIEAWRCLEDEGVKWLTCLFNKIFSSAKMPEK
ncbi:hypothetical protein Tco_0687303 [Tanacetum coccineum]